MQTIIPTSYREPGYLVAVSAPNSGIDEMKDGSWHVIADMRNDERNMAQGAAQRMIPFVLGTGGDLVMYRLDEEPTLILRQGGKSAPPPAVDEIVPYDGELAKRLEVRRQDYVRDSRKVAPAKRTHPFHGKVLAASYLAAFVAALCAGGYAAMPGSAPQAANSYAGLDPDPDKAAALMRGAYQVTMPDPNDPNFMVTVRYYPGSDGKMLRHVVDRFQTAHFKQANGWVPKPVEHWLRFW